MGQVVNSRGLYPRGMDIHALCMFLTFFATSSLTGPLGLLLALLQLVMVAGVSKHRFTFIYP